MKARFSQAFGQVIQREGQALGLSQEKFAEIVYAHRNYIGLLERGECGVSSDFAETLARVLNRPLGFAQKHL
ncbi:MAG: helix-turn-helix transcriptional regulator [Candidatus Binatia bacterium]|jgi:transcriptional regulator with XRE-family HTH domain